MTKEKMTVRKVEGKYEGNCLEERFGNELFWNKEVNEKGETVENYLFQEVDGGVRGVDVFGDEHFDKAQWSKNRLDLSEAGKITKRYARDGKSGLFRPCDEKGNIIRREKVENYEPVAQKQVDVAKTAAKGMVLQSRGR